MQELNFIFFVGDTIKDIADNISDLRFGLAVQCLHFAGVRNLNILFFIEDPSREVESINFVVSEVAKVPLLSLSRLYHRSVDEFAFQALIFRKVNLALPMSHVCFVEPSVPDADRPLELAVAASLVILPLPFVVPTVIPMEGPFVNFIIPFPSILSITKFPS